MNYMFITWFIRGFKDFSPWRPYVFCLCWNPAHGALNSRPYVRVVTVPGISAHAVHARGYISHSGGTLVTVVRNAEADADVGADADVCANDELVLIIRLSSNY